MSAILQTALAGAPFSRTWHPSCSQNITPLTPWTMCPSPCCFGLPKTRPTRPWTPEDSFLCTSFSSCAHFRIKIWAGAYHWRRLNYIPAPSCQAAWECDSYGFYLGNAGNAQQTRSLPKTPCLYKWQMPTFRSQQIMKKTDKVKNCRQASYPEKNGSPRHKKQLELKVLERRTGSKRQ